MSDHSDLYIKGSHSIKNEVKKPKKEYVSYNKQMKNQTEKLKNPISQHIPKDFNYNQKFSGINESKCYPNESCNETQLNYGYRGLASEAPYNDKRCASISIKSNFTKDFIDDEVGKDKSFRFHSEGFNPTYNNNGGLYSRNTYNSCEFCFACEKVLSNYTNKTHKFHNHYYCELCIEKPSNIDKIQNKCSECYNYFIQIDNEKNSYPKDYSIDINSTSSSIFLCFFCQEPTASSNQFESECKLHKICSKCIDHEQIHNLKCNDCINQLISYETNEFSKLGPFTLDINKTSSDPTIEWNYPTSYSHDIDIVPSSCLDNPQEISNQRKNNPNQSMKSKSIEMKVNAAFSQDSQKISNLNNTGSNFNLPPIETSSKHNRDSYEINQLLSLQNKRIGNQNPEVPKTNPYFTVPCSMENSICLRFSCSYCNREVPIIGFYCNHNLCDFCLTLQCCEIISDFFVHYKPENKIIQGSFNYICPVQGCLGKINVPSMKVLQKLNEYLKSSVYHQFFQEFHLLPQVLEHWVPFFDGLSFYHVFYN